MKCITLLSSLVALTGLSSGSSEANILRARQLAIELSLTLSREGLVNVSAPQRWSDFKAPQPAVVVNVETESDVASTVQYCNEREIPFLAQNGGGGWATTFDLGPNGVLINLAGLNQVTFNGNKTLATIGGGSDIKNTIAKAFDAGALIVTGNCNCVGALGAMLGGGYGNLMGLHGFGVDSIQSMRVVTADGVIRDVSATSEPDLFWGLRGAGPNLGIVTSAVVKSYPARGDDLTAWTGGLIFNPDKLEAVVQAIQDVDLRPDMNVFMYFIAGGGPTNAPVVLVTPFLYKGTVEAGKAAFASLFAIGPDHDGTSVIPYDQWNTGADGFCTRGGRKPSYGVGFQKMVPSVWRQIWDRYVDFQKKPGASNSVVVLEAYSLTTGRSFAANSSAFPNRDINFNAVAIPWYYNSTLDCQAQAFGSWARSVWRSADELSQDRTYVNFAHGDEALDVVYGSSLPKLQEVKQQYDPDNRFNQWFNIQ